MPRTLFSVILAATAVMAPISTLADETPGWSNYGPAQREFPVGFVMFAEHHDGNWRAWVPSYWGHWTPPVWEVEGHDVPRRGQILEFFTGEVVEGMLRQDEMGHARPEFTTADGVLHAPGEAAGLPAMWSKSLVRDRDVGDLSFVSDSRLDPSDYEGCATTLTVVDKTNRNDGSIDWSRLILDYSLPSEHCPHGRWESQVKAVLDLHDGTFLAALDTKVVRLSFADLSPIGTDATVKIVDADLVHGIISTGGDMHQLLNRALLKE